MFAVLVLYINNSQLKICLLAITKSKAICTSYEITVTSRLKRFALCQSKYFIEFNGFLLHIKQK